MNWISVKDKLAEINEKVLILVDGSRVIGEYTGDEWIEDFCIDPLNQRFFDNFLSLSKYINENTTHWMPLPLPPKDI